MERLTQNLIPLTSLVVFPIVEFIFFHALNRVGGFRKFLSKARFLIESQLEELKKELGKHQQEITISKDSRDPCSDEKTDDEVLRRGDVEMVMGKLCLFCSPGEEKLKENLGFGDTLNLFEERGPSLEELKGAFDVFDENKDGFIDAEELQRVLSILGFEEGSEMESCRAMIGIFDENGDDRIDFNEFIKILEN